MKGKFSRYAPMQYLEKIPNSWQDDTLSSRWWHCCRGFTALGTTIGPRESSANDTDYVKEHTPLKYLGKKIAHYLHDFHHHWFASFGLPLLNESHKQLHGSDIRRLLRCVQHRHGHLGGGSGNDRAEIQVYSSLDPGHKDFFGCQFVNGNNVRMDFVFIIPPPPFYEGARTEFEASLDICWYGRVVLLFSILVKTDQKDRHSRSVLKECDAP